MVVFLDTAFVLSLILETDETDIAKRYFEETTDSLVISISVYEEAFLWVWDCWQKRDWMLKRNMIYGIT